MNKQSTLPWERNFFFGEEFVLDEVACMEAAFTYILVSRAYAPIIKHSKIYSHIFMGEEVE